MYNGKHNTPLVFPLESDPIKALQGLFPDLPITEVEQALCKELGDVNKAAESLMQGDGMPLIVV